MRWRVVALVSLGVNIVLAAVWFCSLGRRNVATISGAGGAGGGFAQGVTNSVLRRQFFSWQEVESPDYPTYISNLHYIGCPDQTIRDIIIADINALYARRRASELITPEQQWWRTEPDTNVLQVAAEKARVLDDERRALLTRLLGPNWESGDLISLPRPSRPGILLDGPLLGALPAETKQAIQVIALHSEDRIEAYIAARAGEGKEPDPTELAKLRQQTRDELAQVLPPGQLEEYLLRYSQQAKDLRSELGELAHFNASADEFRAMFRATESIDQQLQLLASSTDPESIRARRSLEAQRENALKNVLGTRRFQEYQLLHDPLYRDAVAKAQEAGTPEAVRVLYQINLASLGTQDAIGANSDLTGDQKDIELKQLELDQMKANALATGRQLPPEPPAPPFRRMYTVRQGDSAAVVGMIYGVPESAIRSANPGVDFNRLRPGQSINIPRNAMNPALGPATSPVR
jgi:LysM repeat protein